MKKFNKMIAIMMMMSITFAMPAMAGNKRNNDKKHDVVVVNNKKASHFDKKVDKPITHFDNHRGHAYRPDVKICIVQVSRYDSHNKVVAKAERMKGVMDTKWNPRTRELTIIYDAKVTSARHIKHFVA